MKMATMKMATMKMATMKMATMKMVTMKMVTTKMVTTKMVTTKMVTMKMKWTVATTTKWKKTTMKGTRNAENTSKSRLDSQAAPVRLVCE